MIESVRAARARYLADNGFSEAAYRERWAVVKLGPVPIVFPNTRSRKRALPLHDLHHVATGYATTWTGEAEIGAWEVAAGCTDHWAAWLLDAGAFAAGLVFAPRRVWRAFVRGRHSRTLYATGWDDRFLELTVDELRNQLDLPRDPPAATWVDLLAFAGWLVLFAAPWLGLVVLVTKS